MVILPEMSNCCTLCTVSQSVTGILPSCSRFHRDCFVAASRLESNACAGREASLEMYTSVSLSSALVYSLVKPF